MSVTIRIDPDWLGHCMCGKDAVYTVWCKFKDPVVYPDSVHELARLAGTELPKPAQGIWHNVCDDCVKPDAIHKGADK